MADSLGPVMAMTAVTLFNDIVVNGLDPIKEQNVVVAGAVVALGLNLLEKVSSDLAVGIAWTGLITVLLVRTKANVPAPLEAIANWYEGK